MVSTMMVSKIVKNIMLVEDEEDSRVMLSNLLETQGHTVVTAPNGKKALELFKDSLPDLVITDILMPELDGFDEKYTDKIFKPFQRLQPHHHDNRSGMGLAICKLIIDQLGGKILTKSSPNQGATFTVRLPLKPLKII